MQLILNARKVPFEVLYVDVDDAAKADYERVRELPAAKGYDGKIKALPLLYVSDEMIIVSFAV